MRNLESRAANNRVIRFLLFKITFLNLRLILDNKFSERSPPEIAAMLSTLTCQFDGKGNRKSFYNGNGQQRVQNGIGNGSIDNGTNEQQQHSPVVEVERLPKELLKEVTEFITTLILKFTLVS